MAAFLVVSLLGLFALPSLDCLEHGIAEKRLLNLNRTKCYGDLGCFSTGGDFYHPLYRPINLLPQDREAIRVKYLINTPKYKKDSRTLMATDAKNFDNSKFGLDPELDTKIITHGFIDNQWFGKWMREMRDEFLLHGDYNVIIVDWSGGNFLPYTQATANTRLVGAEIAFFVNTLKSKIGLNPERVHILGHSLGGQIVGYAGERIENLGRITSFDPAEPYYQYMPPSVRIDPTDAQFVEVVHTDSRSILLLGLGMSQLAGHVDFFPNDGKSQPGCTSDRIWKIITDGLLEGARRLVACDHQRAVDYVHDSINSQHCQMVGYACNDYDTFLAGQCASCGRKGDQCAIMGMHSDTYKIHKNDSRPIKLYLKTNSKEPFCLFHYQVVLKLQNNGDKDQRGSLYLTLNGENGQKEELQLGDGYVSLHQGAQYTFLATTPKYVGNIKDVSFTWKSSSISIFRTHSIVVQNLRISPMNDISETREKGVREYCAKSGVKVDSRKSITFSTANNKC